MDARAVSTSPVMGDNKVTRVVYYGDQPLSRHRCKLPQGNILQGTVVFCEDCGSYWRLAEYQEVLGLVKPKPVWYELGMFGIWWYVQRRGTPRE